MLDVLDEGESFDVFLQAASDLSLVPPVVLHDFYSHFCFEKILDFR